MSTQITPDQLGDHPGRRVQLALEAEVGFDGRGRTAFVEFANGNCWHPLELADATITLLPVPVLDEPTGLGAVVQDGEWRAVRTSRKVCPWIVESVGDSRGWVSSAPWGRILEVHPNVEVIHPGVEVPRG